jgi:hypothetical protein
VHGKRQRLHLPRLQQIRLLGGRQLGGQQRHVQRNPRPARQLAAGAARARVSSGSPAGSSVTAAYRSAHA